MPKTAPCSLSGVIRESKPLIEGPASPWPTPTRRMAPASSRHVRDHGQGGEAEGDDGNPGDDQPGLAESRDQAADQAPLDDRGEEPEARERERRRRVHPTHPPLEEEGERPFQGGEGQDDQEAEQDEPADTRQA